LPTGNLRESRSGAKRANVIIVTKCPPNISILEQEKIKRAIGLNLPVFFSTVAYDDKVYNETESIAFSEVKSMPKILLAGIAKPKPFFKYLQSDSDEIMTFPDHHHFSENEIISIKDKAKDKIIITTEKDFVRLKAKILKKQLFYLPIKSQLVANQDAFDQIILNYVGTCTRNR
jgi:tetraacyldisaccharide 4'-kinase